MTSVLQEPTHFRWVSVINLPEDEDFDLNELTKYGHHFVDYLFQPVDGESRLAAVLLPDIESAHNFASEVNEKYIGGRKVYTARCMYLSNLIKRPTVDQCVQTDSEEDLAESPVAIISRHLVVDASIQTDTEKQMMISSLPCLEAGISEVDGDLRQANISAISLPLYVSPPIDEPVMAQQQKPKAKARCVAPSIRSSMTVAPRVNQSAKKVADTTKSLPKRSTSIMVLRDVQKGMLTNTKAPMKRPVSPSSSKTPAKKSEKKEYFCDREGCIRATDPYVREYAFDNHMEKHRQEDGARKKRGASQK